MKGQIIITLIPYVFSGISALYSWFAHRKANKNSARIDKVEANQPASATPGAG
jgi:hypothetical protein